MRMLYGIFGIKVAIHVKNLRHTDIFDFNNNCNIIEYKYEFENEME